MVLTKNNIHASFPRRIAENIMDVYKLCGAIPYSRKHLHSDGIYGFYDKTKEARNATKNGESRNPYLFLSNMVNLDSKIVCPEGREYPSVEALFHCYKTLSPSTREQLRLKSLSGYSVKKEARKIKPQPNWNNIKVKVMLYALRQKFNQRKYRILLLQTGERYLEETNWWGDVFWGVHNGIGLNILGYLLMHIREELKTNKFPFEYTFGNLKYIAP